MVVTATFHHYTAPTVRVHPGQLLSSSVPPRQTYQVVSHASGLRVTFSESPSSQVVGFLPPATIVLVLERRTLHDGSRRARIKTVEPVYFESGWVSAFDTDERCETLGHLATGSFGNRLLDDWFTTSAAPPSPSALANDEEEAPSSPTPPNAAAGGGASKNPLGAKKFANKWMGTVARKQQVAREKFKSSMQSAAELRTMSAEYRARAQSEGLQLEKIQRGLQARLGGALVEKDVKVKEIVAQWTRGPGGQTSQISKMDFRRHIRKIVDEPNGKLVDSLFDEMDADGSQSLDVAELVAAMRAWQMEARENTLAAERLSERVALLRTRAAMVADVAEHTAQAEAATQRLKDLQENLKVSARIGGELLKQTVTNPTLTLVDIVSGWQKTKVRGREMVRRSQFVANVRALGGVEARDDELDELFDSYDADGSGSLDMDELRAALTHMRDAARAADHEVARLKRSAVWKRAEEAQRAMRSTLQADEEAAAARAEADEWEARERARLDEEARAAKANARRKADGDRAAHVASLEARRNEKQELLKLKSAQQLSEVSQFY
jgi:Ca2+-binding EF-hand superfamily protein